MNNIDFEKYPLEIPLIKKYMLPRSPIDLGDSSIGLLYPQGNGFMYGNGNGTFNPDRNFDNLFSKRYNFSYWYPGTIDYALNHLTGRQKLEIDLLGETYLDGTKLSWYSPGLSLKLGQRYLINLRNWVSTD